jgi:hypothetical protein
MSRDFADVTNINVLKLNTSNQIEFGAGTFSEKTVAAPPDQTGFNEDSIVTAFNGDFSKAAVVTSHQITGATTLGQPTTGYRYVPQAYPFYTYLYNSSGHNEGTATNVGRTSAAANRVKVYQAGQGDAAAFSASVYVAATKSGSTSFLANPAGVLLNGGVQAGVDGAYLNAGEFILQDNGFDAAGVGWVVNLERTISTGAKDAWWAGFRTQSKGSAAVDAFFTGTGKARIGLDLSTGDYSAANAAIAIATDQRIYLAASNVHANKSPDETTLGTTWIEYDSGASGIIFVTSNNAAMHVTNSQVTFTRKPFLSDVNVKLGTTTGTKLGETASEKLGHWGVTPIVQPSFIASPTADVASLKTAVDAIRTLLINTGLKAAA